MKPTELLRPEQRHPSKAYLVSELRKAVFTGREQDYPGVTPTTKRLLVAKQRTNAKTSPKNPQ